MAGTPCNLDAGRVVAGRLGVVRFCAGFAPLVLLFGVPLLPLERAGLSLPGLGGVALVPLDAG